jgi:copper(I)-binding protein
LKFAPGGYHVMLEQATKSLRIGDTVPLVFWFQADQAITAPCVVKPANTLG